MFDELPRERFAFLPTPLHRLKNLGESIGIDQLWIKRDDHTGISFGGNKTRKLEFVVGDAKANKCDTLVTVGGIQSNHCRQTAAVAAVSGLRCILLLGGEEPEEYTGNILLDKMLGAEMKFFPDESVFTLNKRLNEVMETLADFGLTPYAIPAGAAMPVGVVPYAVAMEELNNQFKENDFFPDRIIVSVGTSGTLAGLILGAHMLDLDIDIVGITVSKSADEVNKEAQDLIERTVQTYPEIESFKPKINVDDSFIGKGYAVLDEGVVSAMEMFAKMEGIFLDPVYTGKAGLALIRMALAGDIKSDSPTLFYHTGGEPALFTYSELGQK
ncbi:MAG: 1-aminocyclopropane-1-carboxylate deaminase/D-cysteine desulfhydrase [Candidatus Thorarchaeota archaeon]|jgi:D-cysteine desulfhydrase family pyridoxal phosphate-dependent enzyme